MRAALAREEVDAALELRRRVFCEEQGVSREAERDGRDGEALHVVAFAAGGSLVGTCRLLIEDGVARLGRMAVEPALRGRGAGLAVLREAERAALAAGASKVRLHAQTTAASLYGRAGYEARGRPFLEEGIEHVTMERPLA